MQQNRIAPAPIFNARKRPRQAVIADPGSQMTTGEMGPAGAAMYQGLMPPGGYNNGVTVPYRASHTSARGDTNQPRPNSAQNVYSNRQAPSSNVQRGRHQSVVNYGNRNNTVNTTQQPYQGRLQQSHTTASMNNQRNNSFYNQNYHAAQIPENQYSCESRYKFSKIGLDQQCHQMGNRNAKDTSVPGINRGTHWSNQNNGGYFPNNISERSYNYAMGSNRTGSLPGHCPSSRDFQSNQTHPNNRDLIFDESLNDSLSFIPTQMLDNTANVQKKMTEKKAQDQDLTKTLHLLTVRAAGLRRWAKYRDSVQLMFEIFGYLDSAMGRSQTDCKEFLLRDDVKGSINCVFFEIDRQVTKMTRGQWYRVVGTYDQKKDRLKCVSVRPMSEAERPLVQTLVDRSSQELAKFTRKMREM